MSKLIPGNHKHLFLDNRIFIEQSLDEEKSFHEISKYLCRDPSMISRETWNHRIVNIWNKDSFNNPYNFCVHRYRFKQEYCSHIQKAPYVCNGCDMPRHKCSVHTKYDYNAKAAHRKYEELLSQSRSSVNLTNKELRELDRIVRPLIEQG